MFTVIDSMNRDTYRAWEKFRPSLASIQASQSGQENQNEALFNPNTYIPIWAELERFLENEITIKVHSERLDPEGVNSNAFKKQKRSKSQKSYDSADVPDFLQCDLCNDMHPLFKCEIFKTMSLTGRKSHVIEKNLCEKCLRPNHSGDCRKRQCNIPFPNCKPETRYHNSWLCQNRELNMRMNMLKSDNKRRRKGDVLPTQVKIQKHQKSNQALIK